jgi:uncharacterized protein (UPF0276 family)
VLDRKPAVPGFEIHSENYFADGGPALAALSRIPAPTTPSPCTGSGSPWAPPTRWNREHLRKIARLAQRIAPAAVSEHLCWSSVDGRHYNDLLPLP